MKVCPTCNREWPADHAACPHDGTRLDSGATSKDDTIAMQSSPSGSYAVTSAAKRGSPRALQAQSHSQGDEALLPGQMVSEYKIERCIGVGGMGVVYGARHPVIGKRVAIKVLSNKYSADRQAVERFVTEAQAVNQIGHTNIVDIFAFGALNDGRSYFVMEWLKGDTLAARIARSEVSAQEQLDILDEIAQTLEAAHAAGVIHRDLKPENIFVISRPGDAVRIKLLDFGIAKLTTNTASTTQTGLVVGTPLYMSPEQARGVHVDERTDIYSLGTVAFELTTGRPPFRDGSAVEILAAHIAAPPPLPSTLRPGFPPSLESLLLDLLAKAPEQRPTLDEVRRRIAQIRSHAQGANVLPPPVVTGQRGVVATSVIESLVAPIVRRKGVAIVVLAGVVATAALATFAIVKSGRDEPTPPTTTMLQPPPPRPPPPQPPPPVETRIVEPEPPPPKSTTGTLVLRVTPANARVDIGGAALPLRGGKAEKPLDAGDHQIVVTASGYRPDRRTIKIDGDKKTTVAIKLVRIKKGGGPTDVDGVIDPFK
jgi:serine/threonine-protein kinase